MRRYHNGDGVGWNDNHGRDRWQGPWGERSRKDGAPSHVGSSPDAKSPTTAEQETASATRAAAIISFVALVGALIGIFENRRRARQRLTYEWVERMEDLELIEHQAVMSSFLRGGMRPPRLPAETWNAMDEQARLATRVSTWQQVSESSAIADRKTVLQIVAFPNMLEALAGMYNQRLLNRGIVKTHVESQATAFWSRAGWWIDELRPKADPITNTGRDTNKADEPADKIYRDLEKMIKSLAERKRPRRTR
jgi:hypothetical protein